MNPFEWLSKQASRRSPTCLDIYPKAGSDTQARAGTETPFMRFSFLIATLMSATAITPAMAQDAEVVAPQVEVQTERPIERQVERQVEREPREAQEPLGGVVDDQPRRSPEQRQERRAERRAERQAEAQDGGSAGGIMQPPTPDPVREQRRAERDDARRNGGGMDGAMIDPANDPSREQRRAARRAERGEDGTAGGGWQGSGLGGLNRVLQQAIPNDPSRTDRTPEERAAHRDWRSVRQAQGQPYGDDGRLIERRRQRYEEAARRGRQGYIGSYGGGYGGGYYDGYGQSGGYGQGYGQAYGNGYGQGYSNGYSQTYGYSQNNDGWNRDWRRDRRYDWQRYRYDNRDRFNLGQYRAPYGWHNGYRRFSIGISLSQVFFSQRYWINDPYAYRLPQAYDPYRWVRYYDDILLVDLRTGRVVDALYDFFD